jgi:hypothetical protein
VVARWPGHGLARHRGRPAPSWHASASSFSGSGTAPCWVGISHAPTLKIDKKHRLSSSIKWGATPLSQHTLILNIASHTSLFSCSFYFLSCLEQGKVTLESLAPLKKWPLGMNRIMSSSKAMLSYYIYSHTYELEYGFCVMIMIYELVQSCVMRVAHLTLCLTNHITCISGIRVNLR